MTAYPRRALAPDLRCQIFSREEAYSKSADIRGWGLYAFVSDASPHRVYVGRSTDLASRVRAERRLRQHCSHVLVFTSPGTTGRLAVLKEFEKRTLRTGDRRWSWARWLNRMDLFVRGPDRYGGEGSRDMEALVSRVMAEVEDFVEAQPHFNPRAAHRPPPTHVLGSCRDDVHAFGRETPTGFLVYADSRLTSSLATAKDLRLRSDLHVDVAAGLYRRGLITRRSWTHSRAAGLFFVLDHEFSSPIEAAQVLTGQSCRSDPWRLATKKEVDRFFVPEGWHRRW